MKYLSSEEIAKKWGISDRSVRSYCFQGRVNDAYYDGKWYIPDNALKPDRKSRTKNRNLINVLKYQIYIYYLLDLFYIKFYLLNMQINNYHTVLNFVIPFDF